MLVAGGQAAYIHEPLNVQHSRGVFRAPVPYWYNYICQDNEAEFLEAFQRTLRFRYAFVRELPYLRSPSQFWRAFGDWRGFVRGRLQNLRPLVKDPFAVFSTAWFARALDCRIVIAVRHPAAFASSLKRLGWVFQLEDLLAQPLLVRDWIGPFQSQMQRMEPADAIGRAAILWKAIHASVRAQRAAHPDWIVLRHEDLSLAPQSAFRSLYARLDLDFNEQAQRRLEESTSPANPSEIASAHSIHVHSRQNLYHWKQRLTPAEIERIRRLTEGVWEDFYAESSWQREEEFAAEPSSTWALAAASDAAAPRQTSAHASPTFGSSR